MRRSRPERATGLVCLLLLVVGLQRAAGAELAPIDPRQTLATLLQSLRLEVFVNGAPTQLVEPFTLTEDRHLLAKPSDLEDIGIKVPGSPILRSQSTWQACPA